MSEIRLQDMTPRPYYGQSRDFQFIGRLFDVVLNSVKTNADSLYDLPLSADSDAKLIDLMAMTLGFKIKRNYPAKQLKAVCSVLPTIMRQKGSKRAVETAIKAILGAEGLKKDWKCETKEDGLTLLIVVPSQLSDASLLRDLLDYILPAGMSYELCKLNFKAMSANTIIGTESSDRYKLIKKQGEMATQTIENAKIYDSEDGKGYMMTGDVMGEIAG